MTRTEELLALAEEALVLDRHERAAWYNEKELLSGTGLYFEKNARFIAKANPSTIKQLVELVGLQNAVLSDERYVSRYSQVDEVIAAFNKFEGGE